MQGVQGVISLLFDESPSFSAPAVFGSYRVLHQVGSGVLGPVFRTSDPRRSDLFAVKAFKLDLRPDEVVRLADALRRLAAAPAVHPALADVIDAGLEGTTPFLVTEYLIGDTLDVVVRRRAPLPLPAALELLTPMATGLDAAWAAGVGHGALHPRDVFAGSEAHPVKITGAGIARAIQRAGLHAPVRRPYAAPERSGDDWDQRADVYSLAVIAHELLTGRRPAGPNEQDGVFAKEVSPEQRVAVRRVLATALSEQPGERFPSATDFVQALAALDTSTAVVRSLPLAQAPLAFEDPAVPETSAISGFSAAPAGPAQGDEDARRLVAAAPAAMTGAGTPGWWLPDEETAPAPGADDQPDATSALLADGQVEAARPTALVFDEFPAEADLPLTTEPIHREPVRLAAPPPIDDLAYRDVERTPPLDEWRRDDRAVPAWQGVSADPTRSKVGRWVGIVAVCLIAGVAAGYLAAMYDSAPPPAATQLADSRMPAEPVIDAPVVPPPPAVEPPQDSPVPVQPEPADVPAPAVRTDPPARAARGAGAPRASQPPPAAAGALSIRSEPSGAMVTLDGRLVGETPLVLRDLAAGPYVLQVARPGYAPHSERVTVPTGRERALSVALEAGVTSPGQAFGALDVDSTPRGARVLVNGRFVGQSPLRVSELRAGTHTVTLELANHSSVTRRAVVEPGKTAKLIVSLR